MNTSQHCVVLLALLLCCGCESRHEKDEHSHTRPSESSDPETLTAQALTGTWASEVIKTEIGVMVVTLSLFPEGKFQQKIVLIDESPPRELVRHGSYQFRDGKLILQYDDGAAETQSMRVRLDKGDLWVQNEERKTGEATPKVGKEGRFQRVR